MDTWLAWRGRIGSQVPSTRAGQGGTTPWGGVGGGAGGGGRGMANWTHGSPAHEVGHVPAIVM